MALRVTVTVTVTGGAGGPLQKAALFFLDLLCKCLLRVADGCLIMTQWRSFFPSVYKDHFLIEIFWEVSSAFFPASSCFPDPGR